MLVLRRKPGEAIEIDGKATIRILQVNGEKVKIGIEAEHEIQIRRSELPPYLPDQGGTQNGADTD